MPPGPTARRLPSRGARAIVDLARTAGRLRVMDLGPASGRTLEALANAPVRLDVVDLIGHLPRLPPADDESREAVAARAVQSLLPNDPDERVDLILAWDVLDHMPDDVLPVLARGLAERGHPGTRLHVLVHTGARMPARPLRAGLCGDGSLHVASGERQSRPCPRRSPVALERILQGFFLRHSTLLGADLQEMMFVRG